MDLFEAYAHCCRSCLLVFFIALKIKNNIKFQGANARIISGVRLERRVAASLVSQGRTPSAVSRWALFHNLRSHIAAQTSAMFDIHHDDRLIHKESAKERQKQDNEAENALHCTLQKFGLFLSQTNGTLQNIATKNLATPEIEQSLVQARSLGQTQLERFVERRLLSAEREEEEEREREEREEENFLDPISKNNPPTFEVKSTSAATSSEKRKILHADRSILCRLVTAYEVRREVNMQDIFQHALMQK